MPLPLVSKSFHAGVSCFEPPCSSSHDRANLWLNCLGSSDYGRCGWRDLPPHFYFLLLRLVVYTVMFVGKCGVKAGLRAFVLGMRSRVGDGGCSLLLGLDGSLTVVIGTIVIGWLVDHLPPTAYFGCFWPRIQYF